jgi:hypothetical protein
MVEISVSKVSASYSEEGKIRFPAYQNPRHMPPACIPAKLEYDIDGGPHIGEDVLALEHRTAIEHEQRKLLERPLDTVGMDGGHRTRVPGI